MGQCDVHLCGKPATETVPNPMGGYPDLPVCGEHFWHRLWWYTGNVFAKGPNPKRALPKPPTGKAFHSTCPGSSARSWMYSQA